ncbi:MAG: O-antigen ligase family protein [Deltaproteobacteria bacterium]|nr:O-antigen ligase family protein [Deltaproteobacteria bacterium]
MKGLLFTYLLSYGGAAASLFDPFVGLLIYVCFAIIKPESMWHWSMPESGYFSRIIAIALLTGWALHGFGHWQLGKARGIVIALIGFATWSVISAIHAPDKAVAWSFVEAQSKIFLPFLVGMTVVDSVQKLKQLAWVIVLSHGYVAYEFNLSYYDNFNRLQEIGFANMDNNSFAIALVTCVGLAFFLGLGAQRWWQKALAFASAALMAHAVMFSFSRGGMFALIITGAVTFMLVATQPKYYVVFAIGIMVALRLAGAEVRERFWTTFADPAERDRSAQSRVELWGDLWDSMLKQPLVGAGPDHWPIEAKKYGWPAGKEGHSLWLQVGAELGVPGLLFLLLFYTVCMVRLWPFTRRSYSSSDRFFQDAARMVIASLAGFAVAAQFVSLEGLEVPYYIVLIGAGALKLASEPSLVATPVPAKDTTPGQFATETPIS